MSGRRGITFGALPIAKKRRVFVTRRSESAFSRWQSGFDVQASSHVVVELSDGNRIVLDEFAVRDRRHNARQAGLVGWGVMPKHGTIVTVTHRIRRCVFVGTVAHCYREATGRIGLMLRERG